MTLTDPVGFRTLECASPPRASREEIIKQHLSSDQPKKSISYWICKDPYYKGNIPRLLEDYRARRFRELEIGNNVMQLALKNLINGVYGLFGSDFFVFSDYRVAELTTAFGRQILEYMQHIAEHVYGLTVIYGNQCKKQK